MSIRVKRVAIATISGLIALSLGYILIASGIHRYRVWRNAGVWCALGSPEEGWQFGYGPEECPAASESRIQSLNYKQSAQQFSEQNAHMATASCK